ncbi:hypothetical protein [Sediminibacterium sp.]|uniref:hypothetical protein n=1 Tax=Sediminibacterium sp. TaxID=1917865 RepID=UPI0025E1933E|nr:hypothetical protein [Sediminibacterium sp.]
MAKNALGSFVLNFSLIRRGFLGKNRVFLQKIKNKSTKTPKKKIKNLSIQLQLLTFATPT